MRRGLSDLTGPRASPHCHPARPGEHPQRHANRLRCLAERIETTIGAQINDVVFPRSGADRLRRLEADNRELRAAITRLRDVADRIRAETICRRAALGDAPGPLDYRQGHWAGTITGRDEACLLFEQTLDEVDP